MGWYKNIKQRIRQFQRFCTKYFTFGNFPITSTLVLYTIAIVGFIYAAIDFNNDWKNDQITITTLLSLVLPFIAVAASFAIQIISLILESKHNLLAVKNKSNFLAAIENCKVGPGFRKIFLGYFVDEWASNMNTLANGLITIHKDYWKVSKEIHEFAIKKIDCTSLVPLESWSMESKNKDIELIEYKDYQAKHLIKRGVKISRTFIFKKIQIKKKADIDLFFNIVLNQLRDGFELYYLIIEETKEEYRDILYTDFALMDDNIFILGSMSPINHNVYFYKFYDMTALYEKIENKKLFSPVLDLLKNDRDNVVLRYESPTILLEDYRHKIWEFNGFNDTQREIIKKICKKKRVF